MVTYQQLRDARPAGWRDTAAGWRRLAAALAARAETVDAVRARLAADWRGAAAGAALAALAALAAALRAARVPALASDQALCEHASEVERIQQRLAALVAAPGSALVTVDGDGVVRLSAAQVRPDPFDVTVAQRTATAVAQLIEAARDSDERARARLTAAAAEFGAAVPSDPSPPGEPPPAGADPAQVRRWWDSLSPVARAWLLAQRPAQVGALDGVPVAARDTANRLTLERLLASTQDTRRSRALRALADRLDRTDPARAYLIELDPTGDGRVVVAVGDPDRAAHVLTHVPGAGTDLDKTSGLLGRTDRLAAAAGRGGESVSAVLWLGYDAPEWLSAAGSGAAKDGADDLDRFQEGLRATAAGPPAHHTVIGHSYGSLVVGTAARDLGLPVDDVVFVGSPGVGADNVSQLGLSGDQVWSSTARYDVVRLTSLADRRLEGLDPDVGLDRWHGTDPGDPRFGGRSFTSDPGRWQAPVAAHNAYFDEGSSSLATMGAIARGDYGAVR